MAFPYHPDQRKHFKDPIFLATLGFATQAVVPVFRSDDGGLTWQGPATAFNVGQMDRHWIAVDNAPGVGQGLVYLFARDFAAVALKEIEAVRTTGAVGASLQATLTITAPPDDAALLRSLGYPKALSVAGGFQAWKKLQQS
mgnify:CR=1 FL=1